MRKSLLTITTLITLSMAVPAAAQICNGAEDASIVMATLAADLDSLTLQVEQWDPEIGAELRLFVADLDLSLRQADVQQMLDLCEAINRHPEILDAPFVLSDLLDLIGPSRSDESCLSPENRIAATTTLSILKNTSLTMGNLCKASQCITLLCKIVCILHKVAKVLEGVASGIVSTDDSCIANYQRSLISSHLVEDGDFYIRGTLETTSTSLVQGVIEPKLDATVSSRAAQDELDELHEDLESALETLEQAARAREAEVEDLAAEQEAAQQELLRFRIESSLTPEATGRITTFQLPAANSGLLEEAREIVADTLVAAAADGGDVSQALTLFDLGDTAFNASQFKLAYRMYRQAYRCAAANGAARNCGTGTVEGD